MSAEQPRQLQDRRWRSTARGAVAAGFPEGPPGRGEGDAAGLQAHGAAARHAEEHRPQRAGVAPNQRELCGGARGEAVFGSGSLFTAELRLFCDLLVAITFLEGHRSYEGSMKALEQAKELHTQVRRKCMADFVSVVSVLSRGERNDDGDLNWVEPSRHDVSRAAQLLECLLSSGVDQTELLREYGKERFDVIRMFLGDDPSGSSMGFDLNTPVTALAKCLKDIEITIEAEKTLAGLIFSNEDLANGAFRYSAHHVLESWKKDIDLSLRSSKQLDAVKLLLVHDLLLARAETLEDAVLPPLLLRDRDGKGLGDPWVLSKAVKEIVSDLAASAKQKLFTFQPGLVDASGDRTVTRDGNVHPISSHVCAQAKALKVLLGMDSDVTPVSFVDTVVTQLVESLTTKADQLKGKESLKQLFFVNNFGYIVNSLPHCPGPDDADLEKHLHGVIKPRAEAMRNDALAAFIHLSYISFKEYLNDPTETLQYAKGGNVLTLESGRLLKEKFSVSTVDVELVLCSLMLLKVTVPIRSHRNSTISWKSCTRPRGPTSSQKFLFVST
ncbi:unnamed protein product [Phytophthora lilii]|uniref:Unnamed protein product n=1 Tax=Phytophthora lilii TaxID=2077276 RepID=A0A9W6TW20_9STRA|nr:unnamed protein product [Phytophthora lilii]